MIHVYIVMVCEPLRLYNYIFYGNCPNYYTTGTLALRKSLQVSKKKNIYCISHTVYTLLLMFFENTVYTVQYITLKRIYSSLN